MSLTLSETAYHGLFMLLYFLPFLPQRTRRSNKNNVHRLDCLDLNQSTFGEAWVKEYIDVFQVNVISVQRISFFKVYQTKYMAYKDSIKTSTCWIKGHSEAYTNLDEEPRIWKS